jgi:DNA modification methylase
MDIIKEIEFYDQKLKEAKTKLYEQNHNKKKNPKIIDQIITKNWSAYHGDCIKVINGIPSNSIHYSIFSPPFASLFVYSAALRDMGNSTDNEFYDHFNFLVPELYRVIMPGRLVSIHCMDLPSTIGHDGFMGLKDFPGMMIKAFQNLGFIYHSKVCIWKDPLVQAVRTKQLSLAHKQISKDSSRCNMGLPDYIVTMRKPGENPEPISHGRGFERYIGERPEPDFPKNDIHGLNKYSQHVWQRYASPVWFDIKQTNTLNIKQAREKDDERHICPMNLDVIARCLELWTNSGDIVLSPFGGIGSEGYQAVLMNRKAILIELKKTYYDLSIKYLKEAENAAGTAEGLLY